MMEPFWCERLIQQLPPINLTYMYCDSPIGRPRVDAVNKFAIRVRMESGISLRDMYNFAIMQLLEILDAIENGWTEIGPQKENPIVADWTGYLGRIYYKLTEAQKLLHYHHCDAMDEWDIGHGRFALDGGPFILSASIDEPKTKRDLLASLTHPDFISYWVEDEPPLQFLFGPWVDRVRDYWPEYFELTLSFVKHAKKDPKITLSDLNDFLFMCSYM